MIVSIPIHPIIQFLPRKTHPAAIASGQCAYALGRRLSSGAPTRRVGNRRDEFRILRFQCNQFFLEAVAHIFRHFVPAFGKIDAVEPENFAAQMFDALALRDVCPWIVVYQEL